MNLKIRNALLLPAVLLTLLVFPVLTSCDLLGGSSNDPIAVQGTWESTFGERWIITESTIEYRGDGTNTTYRADIVSVRNNRLNAGDTSITPTGSTIGLGHAIIRYTEVDGPGTGEVGKYQVFRWATNRDDAQLRDFTQGFNNVGEPWPGDAINEVFNTAAQAAAGATNANEHFAFASQGAERQ
ncbi:MAG: hypothetical protein EA403_04550 [Spirochaetaceae bacterium]|nr:MAG: hypothetical protein EA403_04550 [Spirochaetaceae bacterium]